MNYIDSIFRFKQLIIDEFNIEIVENKGGKCGSWKGSSYYTPKFWGLTPQIVLNVHHQAPYIIFSTLAHEFGHHLDGKNERLYYRILFSAGVDLKVCKQKVLQQLGQWMINKSAQHIIEREEAAWQKGFQFLRDRGFYVDADMESDHQYSMRSYKLEVN